MASVLCDLRMIYWLFCLVEVRSSQKWGPVFLGTDYMFLGKNTNSVSGFVGISVPLGGKKSSKEG